MFVALNSLVQTASEAAKKLTEDGYKIVKQTGMLDLEEEYNDNRKISDDESKTSDSMEEIKNVSEQNEENKKEKNEIHLKKQLFTMIPLNWESSEEEWKLLTESALMEENGCVIPPNRILENEELINKLYTILNIDSITKLPQPLGLGICKPSEEVINWLISSHDKLQFRSFLVPRRVEDEQYWVNISWRFHIYKMCKNSDQLLNVMEIVTTEPNVSETVNGVRKKNFGIPNNTEYWEKLRKKLNTKRELAEWLTAQINSVQHEIELASGNVHLLSNIIKKGEITELGDSVSESCKYHKSKLNRLMMELKNQQEKLYGSILCSEQGSLFLQLIEMNELLRSKIEAYTLLSNGSAPDSWDTVSREEHHEISPELLEENNNIDDAVFEAALPWENDLEEKED